MTAAELLDMAQVERLTLNPGDKIILKVPFLPSAADCEYLREQVMAVLPNTEVITLVGGVDIAVLKASE